MFCFLTNLFKLFIMYKGSGWNPQKQTALSYFRAEILTTLFVIYKESTQKLTSAAKSDALS